VLRHATSGRDGATLPLRLGASLVNHGLATPARKRVRADGKLVQASELQDAYAVLASLDSAHERLTAPDSVGHRLPAQIGPLAAFLQ
jgi:hypothetical protein